MGWLSAPFVFFIGLSLFLALSEELTEGLLEELENDLMQSNGHRVVYIVTSTRAYLIWALREMWHRLYRTREWS